MITIDGSQGEGGGQIFRTALSLAMCLGKPVHIKNIRSKRRKPGLMRQHLACLNAAKAISQADVVGGDLLSTEVVFTPKPIVAGEYTFSVGGAGSTSLIFQTVLMPLLLANAESTLTFEGGTHNPLAPSFDFIDKSFLAVLRSLGYNIQTQINRYGFNPAGGGHWQAWIKPLETSVKARALVLCDKGVLQNQHAFALSSMVPAAVGERELEKIKKKGGWNDSQLTASFVDSVGPGNIVSLRIQYENVTAIFEALGEKQISAERVAGRAIQAFSEYESGKAPVCEYLADQLLLPLLLGAGGEFVTAKASQHLLTNIAVISLVAGVDIKIVQEGKRLWRVTVPAIKC